MNAAEYKQKSKLDEAKKVSVRFHRMIAHLYDADLDDQRLEVFKAVQNVYEERMQAILDAFGISKMNEIVEEGRHAFYMEKVRMIRH